MNATIAELSVSSANNISVAVVVQVTIERAWEHFTSPASVIAWNFASDDWCCPRASNDLRAGGSFSYRMEARDGSFGFDYEGTFLEVAPPHRLRYTLGEDREVLVEFLSEGEQTRVRQTFTPEATHSLEEQRSGWQAILDNFKRHADLRP